MILIWNYIYGWKQNESRPLQAFTILVIIWNAFWAVAGAVALFFVAQEKSEPFLMKMILYPIVLLVWVLLFCGLPHFIQYAWARRIKRIAKEAAYWEEYYRQKQFEEHIMVAEEFTREEVDMRVQMAQNYERALRHEDAAQLYEECGMWDEAGKARMKQIELTAPGSIFKAHNIHIDSSVSIKDSVVQRSVIGRDGGYQNRVGADTERDGRGMAGSDTMLCPFCKTSIVLGSDFCSKCGRRI